MIPTEQDLHNLLKAMAVPEQRRDITEKDNLLWLSRNLAIKNRDHGDFDKALNLIKLLLRRS